MKGNRDSSKFFSFFKVLTPFYCHQFLFRKKNFVKTTCFFMLFGDWLNCVKFKECNFVNKFCYKQVCERFKTNFCKTLSNHSLNSCFELKNYFGNTRVNLYVKLVWSYRNITNFVARKNFQVIFIHPLPSTWFTIWTFQNFITTIIFYVESILVNLTNKKMHLWKFCRTWILNLL